MVESNYWQRSVPVIDWSGVTCNVHGCPLGFVPLTPSVAPGLPIYVEAKRIVAVQQDGPNTAVTYGVARLVVRENIREVFRLRAEADTVENVRPSSQPPKLYESPPSSGGVPVNTKPDRVRKK